MTESLNLDQQLLFAQYQLQQIQQLSVTNADPNLLLAKAIAKLADSLEELRIANKKLHQQNEELLSTKQALEKERHHYQNLFDCAPDPYLVTDVQGIIQAANFPAETLLNCRRDFCVGKPLSFFMAEPDHPSFYDQLERITQSTQSNTLCSSPNCTTIFWQEQELSLQPRGQEAFSVSLSLAGKCDRQNKIVLLYWIIHDLRKFKAIDPWLEAVHLDDCDCVPYKLEKQGQKESREQAAIQLREMSTALSNAVEGISRLDEQGRYIFVNEAYARMVGYAPEDMIGMNWQKTVHSEDLESVTAAYQQVLSTGKVELETRGIRKDGSVFYKQLSMIAAYNEKQEFIGHYCFMKDISERKAIEAAVCEGEHLLDLFFSQSLDGCFFMMLDEPIFWDETVDKDAVLDYVFAHQRLIRVNDALLSQYGATSEQLLGRTPKDFFAHDLEQGKGVWKQFFDVGHLHIETQESKLDGTLIMIEGDYVCIYDNQGRITGHFGIQRDITARQQAEQKIHEQAALLDIASDAIFVHDLDQRILYWNQGAERLYGWQAAEVIGKKANELLQEDASQMSEIIQTLLDQKEWRSELRKITKIGKEVIVEARWTLVRDETNQPKFILSVETDITEKKQLEAQFYQAQRLECIGNLASGIAHDFNNVLTPILGISQLIPLKKPNLDAEVQEMVKVIENSANRGANMVKQILTFTRGTGGERVPLPVAPLLREVINIIQKTFPKSLVISENIPEQFSCVVSADPTYLHQVFTNLCVNARDAMPKGGILTISAESYFVDEAFAHINLDAQVGNYVLVTIRDTGTGIAPEICDRIFDPFFTTKELGKGTGLGLSTVMGIVKDYGGFLRVSSEIGQGSEFKVYLPIIEETIDKITQSEEFPQGNGELVLIVDDDFAVQQTTQSLLEQQNYNTLVAKDGIEAIAIYTQHQQEIKVVLMDIMMPNMDGITAVRTLQQINPQVQIIAISGLSSNREPVLAAGAKGFLVKPYSLQDLLKSLSDLIKLL